LRKVAVPSSITQSSKPLHVHHDKHFRLEQQISREVEEAHLINRTSGASRPTPFQDQGTLRNKLQVAPSHRGLSGWSAMGE
jgi:hypothetical protein